MRFITILRVACAVALSNAAPVSQTTDAVPSIPPQGMPDRSHLAPGLIHDQLQHPMLAVPTFPAPDLDPHANLGMVVQHTKRGHTTSGPKRNKTDLKDPPPRKLITLKSVICDSLCARSPCFGICERLDWDSRRP